MGAIDWLEGSVYLGLLTVAGFVCVLRLLGARLVANQGERRADADHGPAL